LAVVFGIAGIAKLANPNGSRKSMVDFWVPKFLNAGDLVPSLRLPDLSGELIDLAQLQTRHTLMLFWSPSCGS
jgi:hypothetical protein